MAIKTFNTRIDSALRIFLCILLFALPFSKAVIETCVISVCILWLIKHALIFFQLKSRLKSESRLTLLRQAFRVQDSPLNMAMGLYLVFCFLSVYVSPLPWQSLSGFVNKTLEWVVVYLITVEVFVKEKHIFRSINILIFSGLIAGVDALLQFYWTKTDLIGQEAMVDGYRATAAFTHPNMLGGFLTIVIPVCFCLLFFVNWRYFDRKFLFLIFVTLVWSLLLTFSRGAIEGTILGLVFFGVILLSRRLQPWVRNIWIMVAVAIFLLTVAPVFQYKKHMTLTRGEAPTVQWRTSLWAETLRLIHERPFLGHGLNTYMPVMKDYLNNTGSPLANGYSPSYAHNCYLQMATETGVLGLAAFVAMLVLLFQQVVRPIKEIQKVDQPGRILSIGILAGLSGFLVHAFVDINFYSLQLPVLFWFMAGILVSLDKLLRKKTKYVIK